MALFLVPIYFALGLAEANVASPFKDLCKAVVVYVTFTRLMVLPTYWLAYAFQWTAPRFSLERGGVVGEGVSPVMGYVVIPVRNAVSWILVASIVGMLIGSAVLYLFRHTRPVRARREWPLAAG